MADSPTAAAAASCHCDGHLQPRKHPVIRISGSELSISHQPHMAGSSANAAATTCPSHGHLSGSPAVETSCQQDKAIGYTKAVANSCPCCKNEATKMCSGCKDIAYCSVECQKKDWIIHKHLCKSFNNFRERPAANMRRVVCFGHHEKQPCFKWMAIRDQDESQDISISDDDFADATYPMHCIINVKNETLLPQRITIMYGLPLTGDLVLSAREPVVYLTLQRVLANKYANMLRYDDNYMYNFPDSINRALMNATKGCAARQWRGPLVAFTGTPNEQGLISEVKDFSLGQYSALIYYLLGSCAESQFHLDLIQRELLAPRIQAVRVVPGLDGNVDSTESLEISGDHPTFLARYGPLGVKVYRHRGVAGEFSPISQRIGMSMVAWKYPLEQPGQVNIAHSIAPMFISIGESIAEFGTALPGWDKVDLDVLLAKCTLWSDDFEDLDIETVTAFAAYCRYHVKPFVDWALAAEETDKPSCIERALKEMTPEKWELYKSQHQKMLIGSNEVARDSVGGATRMGLSKEDVDKVVTRFLSDQLLDLVDLSFD